MHEAVDVEEADDVLMRLGAAIWLVVVCSSFSGFLGLYCVYNVLLSISIGTSSG